MEREPKGRTGRGKRKGERNLGKFATLALGGIDAPVPCIVKFLLYYFQMFSGCYVSEG